MRTVTGHRRHPWSRGSVPRGSAGREGATCRQGPRGGGPGWGRSPGRAPGCILGPHLCPVQGAGHRCQITGLGRPQATQQPLKRGDPKHRRSQRASPPPSPKGGARSAEHPSPTHPPGGSGGLSGASGVVGEHSGLSVPAAPLLAGQVACECRCPSPASSLRALSRTAAGAKVVWTAPAPARGCGPCEQSCASARVGSARAARTWET